METLGTTMGYTCSYWLEVYMYVCYIKSKQTIISVKSDMKAI